MLDDVWTTRRWTIGAASFAFVALALVVGLMLAGDDGSEPAPKAASTAGIEAVASGSEAAAPEGGQRGLATEPCEPGAGGACREASQGEGEEPAGSTQETPTTDDVVASPGHSDQEQDRPAVAGQPNANPDHYGPGGEPEAEPSLPTAEGVRDEAATAPSRNPDH
jgi:hypothetical protein